MSIERRKEVLDDLGQSSAPGFDYFLLVVLSCAIATFGLITDSAAVIIGAMLVAPLMSPILGLSLASVAGRQKMFQRAAVAEFEGILLAIVLSWFVSWLAHILPFGVLEELPGEVMARTRPTPFDLGIALAGGAAAAYALAQPRISAALPCVAIATALMPPLCTVGIGLSLGRLDVASGAFLLFLTNFMAISFAGIVVFAGLGFRPESTEDLWWRIPRTMIVSAVLVLLTTIPLVALSLRFVEETRFTRLVRQSVLEELITLNNATLLDLVIEKTDSTLNLRITARASRHPLYN